MKPLKDRITDALNDYKCCASDVDLICELNQLLDELSQAEIIEVDRV